MDRFRVIVAWLISLFYWLAGGAFFVGLSLLLPLIMGKTRSQDIGQEILRWVFRGFIRLLRVLGVVEYEFIGFDRLRAQTGGLIVAPNHPALWDAVFILAELDHAACVLKAGLMRNPILFGGATAAGFIPNEPSHRMLRQCIKRLRSNGRLLFFPEGTRTRLDQAPINELTSGLVAIAKNSGAPIWPVFVRTNSHYLSKGWSLWKLPSERVRLQLEVGDPLMFEESEDPHAFLIRLRERYQQANCGWGKVADGTGS